MNPVKANAAVTLIGGAACSGNLTPCVTDDNSNRDTGRLLDLTERRDSIFRMLKYCAGTEADRMLDMDFYGNSSRSFSSTDERQTLLFSANMSRTLRNWRVRQ